MHTQTHYCRPIVAPAFLGAAFADPPAGPPTPDEMAHQRWHDDGGPPAHHDDD